MKKNLFSLGLIAAAAFTLTNCAQEIENPNQAPEVNGYPFEIVAKTVETKTVNEGMVTKWVAGDAITLFHAASESTDYSSNNKFTITEENLAEGKFTGELVEELAEYNDWYALYPYSDKIATPGAKTTGYTYIGYSSGLSQTGYDSKASLKGSVCPLYGLATEVEAGETPEMTMRHLSSVVELKVTNTTEEPLIITSASLTATEDIVGSYFIDITTNPIAYTASDPNYVKSTATVKVSGGTELAEGESACLYLAIKPFTAPEGEKLLLTVNGYEKELPLEKNVTFAAGKIKTINFAYDFVPAPVVPTEPVFTWDLTKATYSIASDAEVQWRNNFVNMTLTKNTSSSNANNYLGGTEKDGNVYAHTRVYKNQILTFEQVAENCIIEKIEFTSTSESYATALVESQWTNAVASAENTIVTVVPENQAELVSVQFGEATRFTAIKVYSKIDPDYVFVAPTLQSISVDNPQVIYYVGDEFSKPNVYATYSNGKVNNVTESAVFSGFNSGTAVDTQTITVTFDGKSITYDITIKAIASGSGPLIITLSTENKPCDSFPEGRTGSTTTETYVIGDYSWTFAPSSGNKFSYYTNNGTYILWGKSGGYILLPAVDGKKLTKVTILTGKGASTSVKVGVYNEEGTSAVTGGEAKQLNAQNSEFSWNLSGTEESTHYQLRVTSAHNAQLQTLTLRYED